MFQNNEDLQTDTRQWESGKKKIKITLKPSIGDND